MNVKNTGVIKQPVSYYHQYLHCVMNRNHRRPVWTRQLLLLLLVLLSSLLLLLLILLSLLLLLQLWLLLRSIASIGLANSRFLPNVCRTVGLRFSHDEYLFFFCRKPLWTNKSVQVSKAEYLATFVIQNSSIRGGTSIQKTCYFRTSQVSCQGLCKFS